MSSGPHGTSSSASSSSRKPLESLIVSLVPALAPPRDPSSRTTSRASSRPDSASGSEAEKQRREKIKDLVVFCEEVLASRLPSSAPLNASTLPEAARRIIYQSAREDRGTWDGRAPSRAGINERGETGPEKALRFGGTWSKLEKGKTLASPLPHLQFLLALSAINPANAPSSTATRKGTARPTASSVFPSTQQSEEAPDHAGTAARHLVSGVASADWKAKGKSKADVLKAWRTAQSRPPFPEQLLLRDTLYLLQGIDGRYVRFALRPPKERNPYSTEKGRAGDGTGFALGKDAGQTEEEGEEGDIVGIDIVADEPKEGYVSQPTRTLLMQISEMGMLYRKVTNFVEGKTAGSSKGGMTEQSLCHFLHHELSECHRLLAVLESQMLGGNPADDNKSEEARAREGAGLTLLRLGLWTEDIKLKMRLMAMVVDDAKTLHGGALVSKIHQHTRHGDPFVRDFMDMILEEVSKPFFATLQRWIFSGDLHDPFQEFFVQLNPDTSLQHGRESPYAAGDVGFEGGMEAQGGPDEAHQIWEKKYVFVKGMVPGFVSQEFGRKIFSTGRSLNFIRYSCRDSDWIETQAKLANAGKALKYSDLAGLERTIDDAYSIASQRLLEIFFDKFSLLDHLRALKSYLMLGAGDFAELLMEALAPRLSKPAISLYRHHLTSDLETAIRGSNAQYDSPDILRRLDARILEYSHGEVGWDCFALEYKVEAPLNAVLDTKAMVNYDKLFHHLWRMKRVETALTRGWMRVTSGSRLFERIDNVKSDWHHCRIVQAEMVHFLRQIQAYCQLEVIECSWSDLVEFMSKREGDMDSLIKAHKTYLDRIVRKVLLLGSGSRTEKEEVLLEQVRDAMDCILQFRDATDELYAWSLSEATRLDRQRDEERGIYSGGMQDDPVKSLETLRGIRERVRTCSINFQHRLTTICHLAAAHQDLDVRFLAIRIAFNGYYELRKPRKATSKANR